MTFTSLSLPAGLLVGFSVAMPIGPMGLLCIQRTLASGTRHGISTGMGAATVNILYAGLIIVGLGQLAPAVASGGRVLGVAGGLFLLWSAARTMRRRPAAAGLGVAPRPLAAYGSALAFNLANPLSPLLILALLTPLIGAVAPSATDVGAFLLGMFLAAGSWWVCLCTVVGLLRARMNARVLVLVNRAAGVMLTVYGLLALLRSVNG